MGGDQETRGCFRVQSGGRGADVSRKATAEAVHSAVCRGSSWHCGTRASGLDGRGGVPPPSEAAESREEPQPEQASPSEGRFLQWLGHRGHGERFRDKREVAEVRAKSGRIRHVRPWRREAGDAREGCGHGDPLRAPPQLTMQQKLLPRSFLSVRTH